MKGQCVIYRQGGTERPVWNRTVSTSPGNAQVMREEIRRMGYFAMVEDYEASMKIGLPEGWEYEVDQRIRKGGV